MRKLNKEELILVEGGKTSAAYLNSILRGATFILELSRSLGTAIRRITSKKNCAL